MSREAAETIIRAAFPHEPHPEDMVSEVFGNIDTVDAEPEGIAHDLWMLGAGVEHDGCPYGGPEPEDGHYENACGMCRAHLLAIAERIAAEVTGSSVQEPEHGPDWSDWDIDHPEEGPSCRCGFNGSPEECAASRSSEREPGPCQERHPDPADDVQCWLDAGHDGEHVVDGGTYRWSTPASTTPDAYADCVECGSWPTHAPTCPRRQGERRNG